MIAFAAAALAMLAVGLIFVLWPLLRRPAISVVRREHSNLDIHRDQLAELARDLESGTLAADRYEQAKSELERRVLEEAAAPISAAPPAKSSKAVAIIIGLTMPSVAVLLYLYLGNLPGLVAPPDPAADAAAITADQFQDMTAKLAARLRENPADAQGWTMLGRAYRATERFAEANEAFGKALQLTPRNADLMADYAESLALAAGRTLIGEPTRLLDRALKIDARNTKVLTLAGSAAFERKDYRAAIRHWEAIVSQPGVNTELAQALQTGIAESKSRLNTRPSAPVAAGKERVSGTVVLDAALKDRVQAQDTVFVFARTATGARMPLAISRIKVADLPYQFSFDDSMAMMPERKLSQFTDIVIAARVTRSGSATPSAGDLEGVSAAIKPGRNGVRVTIDRAVALP